MSPTLFIHNGEWSACYDRERLLQLLVQPPLGVPKISENQGTSNTLCFSLGYIVDSWLAKRPIILVPLKTQLY